MPNPKKSFNKISGAEIMGLELFNYVGKKDASAHVVRRMIRAGAWLTGRNTQGSGVVMQAVLAGNAGIVRQLVKNGADFRKADKNGFTPAMAAVYLGLPLTARELARAGARLTRAEAVRVLKMLVEEDAIANATNKLRDPDAYVKKSLEILKILPLAPKPQGPAR